MQLPTTEVEKPQLGRLNASRSSGTNWLASLIRTVSAAGVSLRGVFVVTNRHGNLVASPTLAEPCHRSPSTVQMNRSVHRRIQAVNAGHGCQPSENRFGNQGHNPHSTNHSQSEPPIAYASDRSPYAIAQPAGSMQAVLNTHSECFRRLSARRFRREGISLNGSNEQRSSS